jgi:hypothetical protein
LLNEFFLYVLEDLYTTHGLGTLQFISADPAFVKETVERVYPLNPATTTAPEMPDSAGRDKGLLAAARCLHWHQCLPCCRSVLPTRSESSPTTAGFPQSAKTSDSKNSRMIPALGLPSPVRRGSLPRPRRRPQRRGERSWGSIQDFKTSARSSHQPRSPRQEGTRTLKSFIIPYPKLCNLPNDITGGLAMISWSIS